MRAFGIEPEHPFRRRRGSTWLTSRQGPLATDEFVLNEADGGLGQRVVPRHQLRLIR